MGLIDRRIGLLFLAFVSLLTIAVVRATYLGAVRAGSLQRAAVTQQVSTVTLPAERGSITDRNGVELAISQSADDIAADPYLIKDPLKVATQLAPLLGKPQTTLLTLLSKPHTGFVYLAHLVPGDRAAAIAKLHIDGLSMVPQIRRVYPRSWAASQVLGTVGWDDRGLGGVEYRYDQALRGRDGIRKIVNDAIGQPISINDVRPTQPGKTVTLTVDAALQDEVEQVLAGVGAQYSPRGATAIAMNPNTGEILALANWPRVNANDVAGAPSYASEDRAVSFNYEPGSTFKAFTVAGALQDGVVNPAPSSTFPSVLQVADRQIHDAEIHGDETLSVADILRKSSNIGADEIGMKLGAPRFDYWVHKFGFGARTGVDLPGEERGHRSARLAVLRLLDGQPADGTGRVGDADPDGHRLFGHRQRRASCGRPTSSRRSGARPPRPPAGTRVISPDCRGAAAGHAPGRVRRRRAPPRGQRFPATTWPARPARRMSSSTASTRAAPTSRRSSASSRPTIRSCWWR